MLLSASSLFSYASKTADSISLQQSPDISQKTIQNGNQVYPPSSAFAELLQRSAYITKPETQKYLKTYRAPLFQTLTPYYVVQRNGTSCSLATATMILNAVREIQSNAPVS